MDKQPQMFVGCNERWYVRCIAYKDLLYTRNPIRIQM